MTAREILKNHNLRRTACREEIIETVLKAEQALSETEIRERLAANYDRTTFYRSFKTLEEHKIFHKIMVDKRLGKFALDNSVTHKNEHAHFFCNECHAVQCMDSVPVKNYPLPEGYSYDEAEVLIKGICAVCKNRISE